LLTLTIGLSACSTTPRTVEYTPTPIDRPELILPDATVLDLRELDFIVITPDNVNEEFAKLNSDGEPVVLVALTAKQYETLSLNIADLLELISQQKAIIMAYEDYYNMMEEELNSRDSVVIIPVEQQSPGIRDRLTQLFK
jgi:PHD/YefM family antitoxin component YafN of YafNO toxin-antitoxin module